MVVVLSAAGAAGGETACCGCRAEWTERTLLVGNGLFTREYAASAGVLRTLSVRSAGGGEWQCQSLPATNREPMTVSACEAKWGPVGVQGLHVRVEASGKVTELDVYPNVPGVVVRVGTTLSVPSVHDLDRDFDRRGEWTAALNAAFAKSDEIAWGTRQVKITAMTCIDQTDIRNNYLDVSERLSSPYDWAYTVAASLLDCRDVITDEGMVFVRLAPMPSSRPAKADDFIVRGGRVAPIANGYPLAELAYRGGDAGRQRAVIAFQRALRPYRPERDGVLLSNTWGAGNRDSRICQDFLLKEIEAGAKMGVDVIQIDDGWQHGRTQNSDKKAHAGRGKAWNGYWAADPDFWKEDRERFPDGLDVLVKKAASHGIRFGLWFGPDSSDEAANWERDADCLLDYHRRLGIDYFKMDSMKLRTPLALQRNRMMFDRMLRESDGGMVFDLDCTAEVRPGFLGLIDIGPVFVENRNTRGQVYWPHQTLRHLWDLSHVVDPVRMRFEFNNPDTNGEKYGQSPLAHVRYRPDALFATVMAASPLAWMELSDVSEASIAAIAPLVARWKAEREQWHGGTIHPVGGRPDGMNWTGFVSERADGHGGYALLFRELNPKGRFTLDLGQVFGPVRLEETEVIGGSGTVEADDASLSVEIPEKLGYAWVKFAVSQ